MTHTFYFSHDYNTRFDKKIKKLIAKHKMSGYGIYWAIIEDLYNNSNELHIDYKEMARDYRTKEAIIKSVINDFELFVLQGNTFGSLSVEKRLTEREKTSKSQSEKALKRWAKPSDTPEKKDATALPVHESGIALKERKGKKEKENKIKVKENIELTPTEIENLKLEFSEGVYLDAVEFLFQYKLEKGYKTKDDNLTIRRWVIDAVNERKNKKNYDNNKKNIGDRAQPGGFGPL